MYMYGGDLVIPHSSFHNLTAVTTERFLVYILSPITAGQHPGHLGSRAVVMVKQINGGNTVR